MDGVSATASVGAILGITAKLIRISSDYIRSVKGATKSAEILRKELRDFRAILEEVEDHANNEWANGSPGAETKFLKVIEESLAECKLLLAQTEKKLGESCNARNIGKALVWPFKEKEFEKTITSLRSFKETFHLAVSLDQTVVLANISEGVKNISTTQDIDYRIKVLAWLDIVDVGLNHSRARKQHYGNTGAWFLDGEEYNVWRTSPRSFAWLYGIPGCGKSILSSSVVENLQKQVSESGDHAYAVAYFYFDFNDTENRTVPNFLSSILAQLCRQCKDSPDVVRSLYDSHIREGHHSCPSTSQLVQTLLEVSRRWQNVYLVVDALDECEIGKREELLEVLQGFCAMDAVMGADLRVLVTSRPEHDIKQSLDQCVDVSVCLQSDRVDVDIGCYVRSVMHDDKKMRQWPAADKQMVEHTLTRKAQGMYVYSRFLCLHYCIFNKSAKSETCRFSLHCQAFLRCERFVFDNPTAAWSSISSHRGFRSTAHG